MALTVATATITAVSNSLMIAQTLQQLTLNNIVRGNRLESWCQQCSMWLFNVVLGNYSANAPENGEQFHETKERN
jgi:hypothetical protein